LLVFVTISILVILALGESCTSSIGSPWESIRCEPNRKRRLLIKMYLHHDRSRWRDCCSEDKHIDAGESQQEPEKRSNAHRFTFVQEMQMEHLL
jgi:hypothetical protein